MNALEVIAKALEQCNGKRMPEFEAANVYSLLNKAGFVILHKSEVQAIRDNALEEAANRANGWHPNNFTGQQIATAIRKLK